MIGTTSAMTAFVAEHVSEDQTASDEANGAWQVRQDFLQDTANYLEAASEFPDRMGDYLSTTPEAYAAWMVETVEPRTVECLQEASESFDTTSYSRSRSQAAEAADCYFQLAWEIFYTPYAPADQWWTHLNLFMYAAVRMAAMEANYIAIDYAVRHDFGRALGAQDVTTFLLDWSEGFLERATEESP